jgi:hypothetical protein
VSPAEIQDLCNNIRSNLDVLGDPLPTPPVAQRLGDLRLRFVLAQPLDAYDLVLIPYAIDPKD